MDNWRGLIECSSRFMGAVADYKEAKTVIFGAPMDWTTSFRPGARLGPDRIREASYGLEEFSLALKKDLSMYSFHDLGNVLLPPGNIEVGLRRIEEVTERLLADGKKPVLLGGEHLVSLPAIRQVARVYDDLIVLHLDAHADLREEYLGEELSHATVIRRVAEIIGPERIYQLGIRSGTSAELAYALHNTHFYPDEVLAPLEQLIPDLKGQHVYLTLDIDVVDPAFAPGTGTPEPGGITSRELLAAVRSLSSLNLVGFDLVEVAPLYDQSERTAILAAKVIREFLLLYDG